jgi:putative DNA primase/helicase
MMRLDDLADDPVWVAWRNEPRGDKLTKVPYSPHSGGAAKSDDPATWGAQAEAAARVKKIVNGLGGGIGVMLGIACDARTALGGIDLDTCRDAEGQLANWAVDVIARFNSYTEISPSGDGVKVFFRYRTRDVPHLRELMGTDHGRQFKRPGRGHPPAIELYLSHRYFAVTGEVTDPELTDLRLIGITNLTWLLREAGPAFVGNGAKAGATTSGRAHDQSRSGAAFRLGLAMRRAGRTFDEFREALQGDPDTASWYDEKGAPNDERECRRIWDKANADRPGTAASELPTIRLRAGNRPEVVEAAIAALDAAGVPLYRRGLSFVHVARIPAKASDGRAITAPAIVSVLTQQLLHELGKVAVWEKLDGRSKQWGSVDVPPDIAARIAALPNEWKFAPLAGIIGTQTLRPDGSLLLEPGYDAATGYLLFDPPRMPPIPSEPTRDQALDALDLLDALLDEFPFVFDAGANYSHTDNPSRSVALSALITPVLRPALPPAVPLHVFKAPAGGTGKSYLADLSSAIATGERCPVISRSPSPDETEKRLVGAALLGQPIISVDNCNGDLRSEFLCQAVERPLLQVRALGSSDLARITNATTCFGNGNNIQIFEDLVRRTIQCSLDADMERPETRKFQRDPLARVLAHRRRYVAAILTIARAYICAGTPDKPASYMSFERWSDLVRGSLLWLGRADPVETVAELSVADPVRQVRAEVFCAVATAMPKQAAGHLVAEIIHTANDKPALGAALRLVAEDDDGRISPKRLGKWLAASENKIAGGYKLRRNDADKSRVRWQLAQVER